MYPKLRIEVSLLRRLARRTLLPLKYGKRNLITTNVISGLWDVSFMRCAHSSLRFKHPAWKDCIRVSLRGNFQGYLKDTPMISSH